MLLLLVTALPLRASLVSFRSYLSRMPELVKSFELVGVEDQLKIGRISTSLQGAG